MNETAIEIEGENWGEYYFKEVTAPVGYTLATDSIIRFTIDENTADELLHIVRADDAQKYGKVTLTKIAGGSIGTFSAGDTLNDATFALYKKVNNTNVLQSVKWDDTDKVYKVDVTGTDKLTTGKNETGKFTITNLSWGEYELKEITPPFKFKVNTNPIKFTVGKNNTDGQELICVDEPALAQITFNKVIDGEVIEAWGTPTFVFTLTNDSGQENNIAVELKKNSENEWVTVKSGTDEPATLSLEPATYTISELAVSRYKLDNMKLEIDSTEREFAEDNKFTITDEDVNKTITLTATNSIEYYDTASYTSAEVNQFNGIKGLRVSYDDSIPFVEDATTIPKTALSAWLIMSNGEEIELKDEKKNLVISYSAKTGDDPHFAVTNSDENSETFTITSKKDYIHNGVYTLTATYKGISCNFDLHFNQTEIDDSKQEKFLVFTVDDSNQCYFTVGEQPNQQQTNTYRLTCIITGTGENRKISKILYNGKIIAQDDTAVIALDSNKMITVNGVTLFNVEVNAVATDKHFDGWETIPESKTINDMVLDANATEITLKAKIS